MTHRLVFGPLRGRIAVCGLCLGLLAAGCNSYDQDADLADAVPLTNGWQVDEQSHPSAPGHVVRVWSHSGGARLTLYRTLPVPRATAQAVADEYAYRLLNLPGARDVKATTRTVSESDIAQVEAVAPGDGLALAPSGLGTPILKSGKLVDTHLVAVGLPKAEATYWLVAFYPESEHDRVRPAVDAVLEHWPRASTR